MIRGRRLIFGIKTYRTDKSHYAKYQVPYFCFLAERSKYILVTYSMALTAKKQDTEWYSFGAWLPNSSPVNIPSDPGRLCSMPREGENEIFDSLYGQKENTRKHHGAKRSARNPRPKGAEFLVYIYFCWV